MVTWRLANQTVLTIVVVCGAGVLAAGAEPVEHVRINQLQFIGTHNSYHVRDPAKPNKNFPDWSYSHAPLDVQLERGVRSFELDLQYRNGEFLVFHVAQFDEGSTCHSLKAGLETVRKWFDAHPRHLPISFLFELKQEGPRLDSTIKIPDSKPIRLACHPSKGPLFVSTDSYAVLAINSETGRVTPTPAQGNFLAVDPANGEYLYTGTQKPIHEMLVLRRGPGI